jgi:hypothetical protein
MFPTLAEEVGERFEHVLVDKYQDTNRLQSSILLGLKATGHGHTLVRDDAPSIHSFQAATVRHILDFPSRSSPRFGSSSHRGCNWHRLGLTQSGFSSLLAESMKALPGGIPSFPGHLDPRLRNAGLSA